MKYNDKEMMDKISMLIADLGWLEHSYVEHEPVTDEELSMWEADFMKNTSALIDIVADWRRSER